MYINDKLYMILCKVWCKFSVNLSQFSALLITILGSIYGEI